MGRFRWCSETRRARHAESQVIGGFCQTTATSTLSRHTRDERSRSILKLLFHITLAPYRNATLTFPRDHIKETQSVPRSVVGSAGKWLPITLIIIHVAELNTETTRPRPRHAKMFIRVAKKLPGRRAASKGLIVAALPRVWRAAAGGICAARPSRGRLAAKQYADCAEQNGALQQESVTGGHTG